MSGLLLRGYGLGVKLAGSVFAELAPGFQGGRFGADVLGKALGHVFQVGHQRWGVHVAPRNPERRHLEGLHAGAAGRGFGLGWVCFLVKGGRGRFRR